MEGLIAPWLKCSQRLWLSYAVRVCVIEQPTVLYQVKERQIDLS